MEHKGKDSRAVLKEIISSIPCPPYRVVLKDQRNQLDLQKGKEIKLLEIGGENKRELKELLESRL